MTASSFAFSLSILILHDRHQQRCLIISVSPGLTDTNIVTRLLIARGHLRSPELGHDRTMRQQLPASRGWGRKATPFGDVSPPNHVLHERLLVTLVSLLERALICSHDRVRDYQSLYRRICMALPLKCFAADNSLRLGRGSNVDLKHRLNR